MLLRERFFSLLLLLLLIFFPDCSFRASSRSHRRKSSLRLQKISGGGGVLLRRDLLLRSLPSSPSQSFCCEQTQVLGARSFFSDCSAVAVYQADVKDIKIIDILHFLCRKWTEVENKLFSPSTTPHLSLTLITSEMRLLPSYATRYFFILFYFFFLSTVSQSMTVFMQLWGRINQSYKDIFFYLQRC